MDGTSLSILPLLACPHDGANLQQKGAWVGCAYGHRFPVVENYLAALEKVYRGVRPSFVKARFMDWPSDPFSKASYSFPAPGQVTTQGPIFRQGIGRLHFAGEYTSYAFMGYMEGALNSGAAAAPELRAPSM